MILNMGFLLRKEMESEFNRKVQYLDQTFLGEVCFKLIGPLPLYSFRCIEIEWTDTEEVREALALFGLKEEATLAEIRNAYYQMVHSLHPDKMGDRFNSLAEFEKVVAAYRLLMKVLSRLPILSQKRACTLHRGQSKWCKQFGKKG